MIEETNVSESCISFFFLKKTISSTCFLFPVSFLAVVVLVLRASFL